VIVADPDGLFVVPVTPAGTLTVGGVVSCTTTVVLAVLAAVSTQSIVEVPIAKCAVALKSVPAPVGVQVTARLRCDFT
jgi:hypothetical protein